ncbi:hypothetical protein OB920_03090 [Halobacteria archaeon HArc-gm2]|nr:hypothetical protein [Halobacteria archaeon HArc-gm2]
MLDVVDEYAPDSPLARLLLGLFGVLVFGLPALYMSWMGFLSVLRPGWTVFLPGLVLIPATALPAFAGAKLLYGLTRESSPGETASAGRSQADESEADPVTVLQRRYAEGTVGDDEFERRMEQLLESDRRTEERGRPDGLDLLTE